MDRWRCSYLIEKKTLWKKEKLLITSNFFFSHNVFQSCLLLLRRNEYLWSKELTLYQTTNFGLLQTKRVCRRQFQITWKWQKGLQKCRKHWEKEKLLLTSNFSFSHSVFKRLVLQTCKKQGLFGKGLTLY